MRPKKVAKYQEINHRLTIISDNSKIYVGQIDPPNNKKVNSVFLSHPVKKSPTAECRKTRRHSELYKRIRKYSLEPSTSLEVGPTHTHTYLYLNWIELDLYVYHSGVFVLCLFPHISFDHVVGIIHDVSCQSEITDLGHSTVGEQNVSGRHISVNALWRFTVNPSD